MALWSPQIGPQSFAATCPADKIFYGGTRGGGKTDCAIGRQLYGAERYGADWNGLVIRRKYKDFAEARRRIRELIVQGLPAELIGGEEQPSYLKFANGARVTLFAVKELQMADSLQGQQYTEITCDEAPNFPFFTKLVDKLNGCLRSPAGVPCHMFFTGNPGGPGHRAVKAMFVDPAPPLTPFFVNEESHVFIPARLQDNQKLVENDPKYVMRLQAIRDPVLRKAWLDGDWSVYLGQAFTFGQDNIIPPMPIPVYAPIYMTFDWGFGKPFSIGWWWVDQENRFFRFHEWYGWNGVEDEGLRYVDSQIADGVIKREAILGLEGRSITRLCDPTCFNKKPDYRGGGQGPSTADEFLAKGLILTPGDPDRALKIRQFRERLIVPRDDSGKKLAMPMMMVYDTCKHFIRTIPDLCQDEDDIEDIDTTQEDHCYDSSALLCMARPLSMKFPKEAKTQAQKHIEEILKPRYDYQEREAASIGQELSLTEWSNYVSPWEVKLQAHSGMTWDDVE